MANTLDELLKKLDEAYIRGDNVLINEINKQINELLGVNNDDKTKIDEGFINNIKGKAVYKNLKKVIEGENLDKINTMKLLSSLVTHMIIECQIYNHDIKEFPIREVLSYIDRLVYNEKFELDEVNNFLKDRYGRYFNTGDE